MNEETTAQSNLTAVDLFSTEQALEQKAKEHEQKNPISLEAARIFETLRDDHPRISEDRLRKLAREMAEKHQQALELKDKMDQGMQGASLEEILHSKAEIFKLENARVDGRATKVVLPQIKSRDVANMLEDVTEWRVIRSGDDGGDGQFDDIPVSFWNPESGLYERSTKKIESLMLACEPELTSNARKDITAWLQLEAKAINLNPNPKRINFKNGVYDFDQHKLIKYSPDIIATNKLEFNYVAKDNPEPRLGKEQWTLTTWINGLARTEKSGWTPDPDKKTLLWQVLACALHLGYSPHLAFWLIDNGNGRSGKGTFQELITSLAGKSNIGSLKIVEFSDMFSSSEELEKPVIIGDDNKTNVYIEDNSRYRSAVTGDRVLINKKNKAPYSINPNCLIIQSMNNLPKFKDATPANARRQRIIKFITEFTEDEDNTRIKDEYVKDRRVLEWLAHEIIRREEAGELNIKRIVDTDESREQINDLRRKSDPVADFVSELFEQEKMQSSSFQVKILYEVFKSWSRTEQGVESHLGRNEFTTRLKQAIHLRGWIYIAKSVPKPQRASEGMNPTDLDIMTSEAWSIYSKYTPAQLDNRNQAVICKK